MGGVRGFLFTAIAVLSLGSSLTQAHELPKLPKDFYWGVSTAAHCIEGNNDRNDFWDWENLPPQCDKNGCACTTNNCVKSGIALDHWNRMIEDADLIADLGVNQYRMSIEWSRIEPEEGQFDREAIAHYRRFFEKLQSRGVSPFVTLQHFTVPRWFRAQGGWLYPKAHKVFARFAARAVREFGDLVPYWVTINEPFVHLGGGYVMGLTPPSLPTPRVFKANNGTSNDYLGGKTPTAEDFQRMVAPSRALIRTHAAAYRAMHLQADKSGYTIQVGLAHHMRVFQAARNHNLGDQVMTNVLDQLWNWTFSDAVTTGKMSISIPFYFNHSEDIPEAKGTQDFFGLNYYTRDRVKLQWGKSMAPMVDLFFTPGREKSMLGWDIYPEGLTELLVRIKDRIPGLPILITENGIATLDEEQRKRYIHDHVAAIQRAHAQGVPIRGYNHYTWADDFELSDGYDPKFGLYHTNFQTLERTLKDGGRYFRDTIRNGGAL